MVNKIDNNKKILSLMGFKPISGKVNQFQLKIYYNDVPVNDIIVDFNEKKYGLINWGNLKSVGRETSSVLSKPEFFAQLYWVIKLMESGYKPKSISIEEPVQLGRKNGFIDILVYDENDNPFMVLDAKTSGNEYRNSVKELQQSIGQVASYFARSSVLKYVGVITSDFNNKDFISSNSYIVSTNKWKQYGSISEYKLNSKEDDLLENDFMISSQVMPYNANNILLKPDNLVNLDEQSSSLMFYNFLTVLRKHGISDKTNAFNKVLNLFIAKIVDEFNTPNNDYMKFQVYQNESLEDLNTRIESLYSQGLRDFIKVFIDTDKDLDDIRNLLKESGSSKTNEILNKIEKLQSKNSSNFQFKDVYGDSSYKDNLEILKELVNLISPFKLKYAKKQQFLGDFFENILSSGFKQESGQFFTPVPLARFMIESLPIKEKINEFVKDTSNRQLLPRMIDFASGSGHFLTEYMDYTQTLIPSINLDNLSEQNKKYFNQYISNPFEWSSETVYGMDVDYRLVKTSKVSSFLNGDGDAIIRRANGLNSFNSKEYSGYLHLDHYSKFNQVFDVLVANPPYHVDEFKQELPNLERDFDLGKYITENSSEIEAIFVERASQLLREGGLLSIILPSSILDTQNKVYVEARKLLYKRFEIKAIMKNPSKGTFMATNVETVTIFAVRRKDQNTIDLSNTIRESLEKDIKDITLNGKENFLSSYIKDMFGKDFSIDDYNNLVNNKYKGNNYYAEEYNSKFKKDKNYDSFDKFVKDMEVERILIYALTDNYGVIVQSPSDSIKEARELLGYKFNERRGQEGIHPRVKNYTIEELTLLYGDKGNYLNKVVKNSFNNFNKDIEVEDIAKPYFKKIKIKSLIDFAPGETNYKLMLSKSLSNGISDYGDENTDKLSVFADIKNGQSITAAEIEPGDIPVIAGGREPAYFVDSYNRDGDIITISQSGKAGYIAYHEGPIFSSDSFTIKAKKDSPYTTKELYMILKEKQEQIYNFATGSIQKHVYSKDMEKFRIPNANDPDSKYKVKSLLNDIKNKMDQEIQDEHELSKLRLDIKRNSEVLFEENVSNLVSFEKLEKNGIIQVKGGKRIPKEFDYSIFKTNHYYPGVKDFEENSINLETSGFIDDKTFDMIKNYTLLPNEIYVSAAGTIGKVGVSPQIESDKTISLTENAHKISIKDEQKIIPRYIMYSMLSDDVKKELTDYTTKTGTPKLSIDSLRHIKIPFVSLEEQKNFVEKNDIIKSRMDYLSNKLK